MATITNTITKVKPYADTFLAVWESLGNADTGTSIEMVQGSDKSVQVVGTFGGATVSLQGSNDGVNYITLTDPQGNALAFTTQSLEAVVEHTRYVRVITTGGTGTSVSVYLFLKGQRT